jgi:hypothetical protein
MLSAKLVTTPQELDQIAHLSNLNLVTNISQETKVKEGFVTWSYSAVDLNALHKIAPSVIAVDGPDIAGEPGNVQPVEQDSAPKVAGYALTLHRQSVTAYPRMQGTLDHLETLQYEGKPLSEYRFYLMGQICVAESHRGKGVVDLLYAFHRKAFSPQFEMLVTEISTSNIRSQKAHDRVGFKIIDTYQDESDQWNVVLWDWRS